MAWFERALARTPNRSRAVLGLARAAAKAGDVAEEPRAYKQFLANWKTADPGLPELKKLRKRFDRARVWITRSVRATETQRHREYSSKIVVDLKPLHSIGA